MTNIPIYNLENKKVGDMDLPEVFTSTKWNATLVRQVILAQLANARIPWAHTKSRADVSGTGKKPWRQKGTGRARHGSTRSPIWRTGGVAHGPRNDKDYSQKVNRKMKQAALASIMAKKIKDGEVKFIDTLSLKAPKTKDLFSSLKNMFEMKPRAKKVDALLVVAGAGSNMEKASRNLVKAKAMRADSVNVYEIVNHKHLLVDVKGLDTLARLMGVAK